MADEALLLDLKSLYKQYVDGENKLLYRYISRSDRPIEHDIIILNWLNSSKDKSGQMYCQLRDERRRLQKLISSKKKRKY